MDAAEQTGSEGIPLTVQERRIWADIEWAEQNEQVRACHAGEWVAIYDRTILAHGPDRAHVLRDAVAGTGRRIEELAIWPIAAATVFQSDNPAGADEG